MKLFLALTASMILCDRAIAATSDKRPNIVVILADDLGYGSVGCYGAPASMLKTPHIDRLAQEGMRFTDANTPSSVCTPTRYALLTGRYCWRSSLKCGVVEPLGPLIIETNRPTLPSMLKNAGYVTGVIGKWHLGFGNKARDAKDMASPLSPGPLQVGFDSYFGIPQNHGEPWGVFVENEAVWQLRSTNHIEYPRPSYYGGKYFGFDAPQRDDWTAEGVLADRAADWIKQQSKDKPFFLYFAAAAIHEPITPSKESQGKSGCGPLGDFIRDLDNSVGKIMKALDDAGFGDNTLVIFTSDNGGVHVANKLPKWQSVPEPYEHLVKLVWEAQEKGLEPNGKFKSGKSTIHQGGFRVPFIARWPGRVPAGAESGRMICLVDVMATISELTELTLPKPDVGGEDSFSFLPNMLGKADAPIRDALVLQDLWGTYAVRKGNWKWIEGVPGMITRNGKWAIIDELPESERAALKITKNEALYDLSKDPGETKNLLKAHPEVAQELRTFLNETRNSNQSRKK